MLWLALASVALLAYTYVGYPIAIALLARVWPARARTDEAYRPLVSVVIPAYNVAAYIGAKLESLLAQDYPADQIEILVTSDASSDETDAIVRRFAEKDPRVRLFRAETRSGKPSALNRMKAEARGEVLIMTDSRQPLSDNAISALVRAMSDPQVGCASGNLRLRGSAGSGFYWRYENWIRRNEGRFRSMVGITGPLYAIRKDDLPVVPGDIILDDMWIPFQLRVRGRRLILVEDAIAWDQAFDDDREFGRKVRTLAGNFQLFARMPRLLFPIANPSWFETFSHKLLRLVCPWALIALLAATVSGAILAPEVWLIRLLGVGQIALIGLALVGARGGRLAGVARTFVVLHVAAVVGLWRYLRGTQKVTW